MFKWGKRTYVMGVINLTPDSFSGDGVLKADDPISYALEKVNQFTSVGADILDIGAESSRPGSLPISAEEELNRILPLLKKLKNEDINKIISIDTYKAKVAKICLENGAHWINDIWALTKDNELAQVIAHFNAAVILMHNRSKQDAVINNKRLGTSYHSAKYANFMDEVKSDLQNSISLALKSGIKKDRIILDPGIGFGKSVKQNLKLINHLNEIKALGYPVLIGPSRKSFIGHVLNLPIGERIEGTAATVAVGITRGADIIRVHDVQYMSRVAIMTDALIS
ncbi:MAG: dihydropteroate synthase [Anaerolineaceae bacterium]|nr:dihydropteroate synthase [Anaerolineaceae bacterium]